MEVRFVCRRWEHHSSHSGYHQLINWLGSPIEPLNLSRLRHKWIPGRVGVWLASNSGVEHYSYLSFFDEFAAVRDRLRNRGHVIYHILYGDASYRYLGSMGRMLKFRTVATYHQPPSLLSGFLHSVNHLQNLDGLIVVGRNQVPFFEPIVGSQRVFFVPHGIDTKVFTPETALRATGSARGVCLFVGQHLRDFATLRRVIEGVSARDRSIRFVVVTSKSNWDIFEGVENVELRCGLPEAELIRLYRNADLLLQPMVDSTANNAILEGMSCGLPVVATDVGSVRDYVDERCSILVPRKDGEAMANAVLKLLSSETRRRQMAIDARERALQYDWAIIAERLYQVYAHVASDRANGAEQCESA